MIETGHYVDGQLFVGEAAGPALHPVHDPSTGEQIGVVREASPDLVDAAVAAAARTSDAWAATTIEEREEYLEAWREKLVAEADALLEITIDELGLIPTFARMIHIGRSSKCLIGLGDMARTILTPRTITEAPAGTPPVNSLVVREPAGVLAAITAWNVPLHQLISKIAAGLIMGNTVVAKPSELKPLGAWRAVELLAELGLPAGVVNVVGGAGPTVGQRLVSARDVDVISFTGSRETGAAILRASSPTITRSVLELGGKSAAIVLPDADLDEALAAVLGSCFFNNGQVCGAQSRLIVHRSQLAEVEERVKALVDATVAGPPRAPGTTLGPVVSASQQARVNAYISEGVRSGLRLLAGGEGMPDGVPAGGYYVRPTVFSDVPEDSRLAQEEIFGPVLVIQPCDDEAEMVRVANGTRYGLAGSVWSGDVDHSVAVARQMKAGQVVVNGGMFNLAAPYGGFRESGNGREHGLEGMAEFTEVKSMQLPA